MVEAIGWFSMTVVCFQFAFQPYLVRWHQGEMPLRTFYILQESLKIIIGFLSLLLTGRLGQQLKNWKLRESLSVAFLPAGLYVIQNFLILRGAANMDGLLFNVVNQTKVVFAAVFLQTIGVKKYSFTQFCALCVLFVSACILTYSDVQSGSKDTTVEGFMCCVGASMLSGLNSAMIQSALQVGGRDSFLLTAELSLYGVFCLYAKEIFTALQESKPQSFVVDLAYPTESFIPVITNALGGTFVGLTTKYAGSVYKGYALALGLIISSAIRAFSSSLPPTIFVAVPLVIGSLHVYNCYPYVAKEKRKAAEIKKMQ